MSATTFSEKPHLISARARCRVTGIKQKSMCQGAPYRGYTALLHSTVVLCGVRTHDKHIRCHVHHMKHDKHQKMLIRSVSNLHTTPHEKYITKKMFGTLDSHRKLTKKFHGRRSPRYLIRASYAWGRGGWLLDRWLQLRVGGQRCGPSFGGDGCFFL